MRSSDPYQWFFPFGILFGMLGTGLWIALRLHYVASYPGVIHTEIMTTGFVMTVALGFLMTAIPRFTGTPPATLIEKGLLLLIVAGLLAFSLAVNRAGFYALAVLETLFILRFMIVRIRKCQFSPPPSFILVAFSLLSSLAANVILFVNTRISLEAFWTLLARLLLNYGFMLGLVLGVGTQLIPALLGLKKTVLSAIQSGEVRQNKFDGRKIFFFAGVGLILLISFLLEASQDLLAGRLLRALLVTALVLSEWRIYKTPSTKGIFSWCLWISAWMLVLGQWPGVLWPAFAVHGAHVLFVGSVSLMIFTVATRVTLSHGGHGNQLEMKSRALLFMLIFFILALVTRLSAPLITLYFDHLAYAALLWILAALCWCIGFTNKIIFRNTR